MVYNAKHIGSNSVATYVAGTPLPAFVFLAGVALLKRIPSTLLVVMTLGAKSSPSPVTAKNRIWLYYS